MLQRYMKGGYLHNIYVLTPSAFIDRHGEAASICGQRSLIFLLFFFSGPHLAHMKKMAPPLEYKTSQTDAPVPVKIIALS